jgi:hypothetical protein
VLKGLIGYKGKGTPVIAPTVLSDGKLVCVSVIFSVVVIF